MPLSGGYSLIVNPRRRLSLVFQHNPPLFRAFFFHVNFLVQKQVHGDAPLISREVQK